MTEGVKKSNTGKIISIIIGVLTVIVLIVGGLGYYSYSTSPQRTYLKFSEAVKNNDEQALSKLISCEDLKKNFLGGLGEKSESSIDCNSVDWTNPISSAEGEEKSSSSKLSDGIDDQYLAHNIVEAYTNGYFVKKGDKYELEIPIKQEGDASFEADITFIFAKVSGDWKVIDIDLGAIESLIQAFSGMADSFSKVDQEFTVKKGEAVEINNVKYSVVEVDEAKELSGKDFFEKDLTIKASDGKKFIKVLTKRELNDKSSNIGAPNYLLKNKESGKTIDSISGFDEEYDKYERITDLESSVPEQYQQIEKDSYVKNVGEGFSSSVQMIYFEYKFFEVDENDSLTSYNAVMEQLFASEGENSFRAVVEL